MKSFLKKILFGTNITQEYLCLPEDGIPSPLKTIFKSGDLEFDITGTHLFLGYKPVVIGIIFEKSIDVESLSRPHIDFISNSKRIASLQLKLNSVKNAGGKNLAVYECVQGSHNFVNPLQKQFNGLYQRIQKKKLGNVNLPGNLYEQVKIAYSIPRKICLITLGENNLYNMFPTDLHGMIDDENYVISLRTDGKANAQVNQHKEITLSKMNLNRYRYVYSLGKNHMQELKPKENFVMEGESEKFHLPLPAGAVEYLELEHNSANTVGIHNLNYFKIVNKKTLAKNESVLSHVHREYLSWCLKIGHVEYLLR